VTVLTLPPQKNSPMVWESFPSCSPDKRPTRTVLDWDLPQSDGPAEQLLRQLHDRCGGSIDTVELLRTIELESMKKSFPPTLPVRCVTLSP
jgi:hypothetical protein